MAEDNLALAVLGPELKRIADAANFIELLETPQLWVFRPDVHTAVLRVVRRRGQKRSARATMDLLRVLLPAAPWALLSRMSTRLPYICAWGLFSESSEVRIQSWLTEWPAQAYLTAHHRRPLNERDTLLQYLPAHKYGNNVVITDLPTPGWALPVTRLVFGEHNLRGLSPEERFWALVTKMRPDTLVHVFPDRDGAQFAGDLDFAFRPGVFAASVFTGVPVIDLLAVESPDRLDIQFVQWTPPVVPRPEGVQDAATYAHWRAANDAIIREFTATCESKYKKALGDIEARHALCSTDGQHECPADVEAKVQRSIERNKRALAASLNVLGVDKIG